MNNEDKLFELMTKMYAEMQEGFKKVEHEFNEVNTRLDNIENKLDDIDVKNAHRHLDFVRELKNMKHSVNRIEINTAENWRDIARLKSMRKYKTK